MTFDIIVKNLRKALTGVAVLFGCSLGLPQAEDATFVCKGEYSTLVEGKGNHSSKLDEWVMYARPDNFLMITVRLASDPSGLSAEHYVMTPQLKPVEMSTRLATVDTPSIRVSCQRSQSETKCNAESGDSKESLRITQTEPYVVIVFPEELTIFYDVPWFYQRLASQAQRASGQHTGISIISALRRNDVTGDTHVVNVIDVEYLGRERIQVLNQKLLAHKYHIRDPKNPKNPQQDLWTSNSGILLKATAGYRPALILSAYEGRPLE